MIKDLIKLADHLDGKGYPQEAEYIDALIKNAAKKKEPETIPSKWHKYRLTKAVDEMERNGFHHVEFKLNGYQIKIDKIDGD